MRVLVAIPHYYDPAGHPGHGSSIPDPQPRLWALTQCLRGLLGTFGGAQEWWVRDGEHVRPAPANASGRVDLDIVVCTTGSKHLLDRLAVPVGLYEHRAVEAEPALLGYECHRVLVEHLGEYDVYGYMEDDLVLLDPAFFAKQVWFQTLAGDGCVLQPNRFEFAYTQEQVRKVYIDFDLTGRGSRLAGSTAPVLAAEVYGRAVSFEPANNPHAGCFFLTAKQLARWAAMPYFLDRAAGFVGPLESAATLGVARTFAMYKPAAENASFLEIQHYGQAWSHRLRQVRF